MEKRKVNLLDNLKILIIWRKFLFFNSLIICIIALIFSLLMPRWYTSNATILPPTSEGAQFGLASFIKDLPFGDMGFTGVSGETSIFMAILDSRTLLESVVRKFNLMKIYKEKYLVDAIRCLRSHLSVKINEDETISLTVEAGTGWFPTRAKQQRAQNMAKEMADFILSRLDSINKKIKLEKAKNQRIFIEKRYLQNLADLKNAENKFRDFQDKYGAIALPEQTQAAITAAAELKAAIYSKEVELGVMETYLDKTHPEFIRKKRELEELRLKLNEMKFGDVTSSKTKDIFLPFETIPEMGMKYARLFREVLLQEKLLEFLLPQYEQAKIQEAKNTPTVQVLDKPNLPEKKSRPKRIIVVLLAGIISLFFGIVFILIREHFRQLKEQGSPDYKNLNWMINEIKNDFRLKKH
ncbi:MAG: GumC family protein [Promethearchaeota archaeon]